jgi:predicted NUDIX family phosphoesterase
MKLTIGSHATLAPEKHSEFILTIEKSKLPFNCVTHGLCDLGPYVFPTDGGIYPRGNDLTKAFENFGFLARRAFVESRTDWIHPIPYVVFTRKINGVRHYFVYRRNKGVGEEKLLGNLSIGVGGHADHFSARSIDMSPCDILFCATQDEITSELQAHDTSLTEANLLSDDDLLNECNMLDSIEFTFTLFDPSNEVGMTHLGLVTIVNLGDKEIGLECKEPFLETIGWLSYPEILLYETKHNAECENWTNIILDHLENSES